MTFTLPALGRTELLRRSGRAWFLAALVAACMCGNAWAGANAGPWALTSRQGAAAQLADGSSAEKLHVQMGESFGAQPWDVQLELKGVTLKQGARHRLEFRARAKQARTLACGVGMAHAPWKSLGLYRKVNLATEFELFALEFTAEADETNGRVYFDLGGQSGDVEIERAVLSQVDQFGNVALKFPGDIAPPATPTTPAGIAPVAAVPGLAPSAAAPGASWALFAQQGCAAQLSPLDNAAGTRVSGIKSAQKTDWHVRLGQSPLPLKKDQVYKLAFRVKADAPRTLVVDVQETHAPFGNLGFYQELKLTTEWQKFHWDFKARADDPAAALQVKLGADETPVEIADFTLTTGDGVSILPVPAGATPIEQVAATPNSAPAEVAKVVPATALVPALPTLPPTPPLVTEPIDAGPPPADAALAPPARTGWTFAVAAGNVAELVPMHSTPAGFRLLIPHLESAADWRVQLRYALGPLTAGQKVKLSLRVRGDGPRPMTICLVSGGASPMILGLAEELALTGEWQEVVREAVVSHADGAAAVELNFGQSDVSAAVADLRVEVDGRPVDGQ